MGPTDPRGPPGQLGGCFGGVYSPGGPLRYGRSRFFGLLCLNNYFKTFQKRRMSKLSLRGTPMGVPPWGGPPGASGAPPGVPRCQRVLEKIAKILKNYIGNLHASRYPKFKL